MGSSNSVAKASPQGQGGRSSHAANNSDQWKAVCTSPDYCKVGNSVVPFDSYADIGRETKSSPDVMAQGLPVYRVGDLHHGVKADAGRHIVCGTSLGSGYVQFLSGHDNVKVNGLPVVRHGSLCRVNCDASGFGGAPGQVVTPEKTTAGASSSSQGNAKPNAQLQALLDKAADGRSVWEKTGDFFSGAWDSTKRLASASYDSPGNAGAGFFKGIGNLLSDMWNLGTLGSKYAAPLGFPNQATIASYLEGAALTAYQAGDVVQANNLASRASEMMSSGYVGDLFPLANDAQKGGSILSAVVPVGAAAKGLATTAKAVRGANAAGAGADAARAADGAADLVKGAEGADVASDTAKASGGGLGVHVQPAPKPLRAAQAVIGKTDGGPGIWEKSPSRTKGQAYQEQIAGVERGAEYKVDGVFFDGYDASRNTLLDAKDWKGFPPAGKDFWHQGTLKEALSQLDAANGLPIEWHFSTSQSKAAVDALFRDAGISGIRTIHTPG